MSNLRPPRTIPMSAPRRPRRSRRLALTAGSAVVLSAVLGGCAQTPEEPVGGPTATRASADGDPTGADPSGTASVATEVDPQRQLPADQWPDPCALLTTTEAAALLAGAGGAAAGPPAPRDDGSANVMPGTCTWPASDGGVELRIDQVVYPINEYWASIRVRFPAALDLDDVGDEAFLTQRPDGSLTLLVCRGRTVFELRVAGVDEATGPSADELADAGRAAAARIAGPAGESPVF